MAFLGGQLRLRQVTRLSDDGHHTPIITARRDLPDIQVAYRMFERWCQENVFKYLREEYALDALADHQLEPADPDRSVPNPARYALDRKLRLARLALQRLASQYGLDALGNVEAKRRTMRGFTIAASTAGRAVAAADLFVTEAELRVVLAPLSSPHRTKAVAALCEELNADSACFPGTNLRLRYRIAEAA